MTNAADTKKKVAPAGFVRTKEVRFAAGDFQTVMITPFSTDGWHPIGLEMLCFGDEINEGGELLAFILEAAGDKAETIDYDALLKCKVMEGVVKTVYTPGIMASESELVLVSGENCFPLTYDVETSSFLVGNLKGKLTERTYKRADDTEGRAVAVLFSPDNPDLKVKYEIPFIFKKMELLSELIADGVEICKELFEYILSDPNPDSESAGVAGIANLLLPTLGSSGERKKLFELGLGEWKVKAWNLLEPSAESNFPANYEIFLEGMAGEKVEGSYYTNKALTATLNQMGNAIKKMKRQLKLIITDIRPFGQSYAVSASLQLIPETDLVKMRSAAVEAPRLPEARRPENAAEFMRTLQPIDVDVVPVEVKAVEAQPVEAQPKTEGETEGGENPDYDPIPF